MGAVNSVPWLTRRLAETNIEVIECPPDSLQLGPVRSVGPDWVVVDSYRIDADQISRVDSEFSCLALVDGDDRGIHASLYLDQNLGSELLPWRKEVRARLLSGSNYALIRDDILAQRRKSPQLVRHTPPRVVAFMGGSDPHGVIAPVVRALIAADLEIELTAVCSPATLATVSLLAASHPWISAVALTNELPHLLGDADVVVSAAGTSAWELCTLGVPSLLIAVVENQRDALDSARAMGVALGIDAIASKGHTWDGLGQAVARLITDTSLRQDLNARCRHLFDGVGKVRVVEALEDWQ
jgi:spore coat polysaccharide biosynthesis predicted glycosyltransferase SpsG